MNIAIFLRYSGKWRSQTEYVDYKSEGIVVAESVNYVKLISSITDELDINESQKNIDVRYVVDVEENTTVVRGVSICISTTDKCQEDILFDRETGAVIVGETVKSIDIDSADDPMDGHYFDWNRSPIQEQSEDVEGCCEDIATTRLDALVKFVVNQNSANLNVGTPSTVHINKDHMNVEGVSVDIGSITLESFVAVVKNLKPDSANVETSTMQVDYSSTLPESAQVELDAILEDFSDAVVVAHQAAKNPAKRIRTRSKVFMSSYTTEYASDSKAIEDQIGEQKQKFAFNNFLISDNMPKGVIEEYKQWVEEGLLKFHAKKKMNDEHYKAKLSSLGVHKIHIDVIFYHLRKKSKLRNDQDYRFTTTNCFFKNYIVKTYSNYYEDETDTVITTQQDYAQSVDVILNEDAITNVIKGYCMPSGLPWHQVDEVYVPINCNDKFHWELAVIFLKDRRIRVYDSLSSLRNMESINEINKLVAMLPTYLSDNRIFEEASRTDWTNLEVYRNKITQRTQFLNEHSFENCGAFVAGYAEYLSEGMNVPSDDFEAEYHRMRYATLLQKYGIQKAQKDYVSKNDDPPRPRSRNIRIPGENEIGSTE
ncbi:uncharacterized protein LOC124896915 [Capsicum annuum]|uniref:uncharacterized protein LOC124896915 n=1 Tax=Capsicum annuum TaxID=4072 RepID=UPI001FB18367|nr:uncharacterized protein LOC124896915 [Capsicum annuum]